MVNYQRNLDSVFSALGDPTRRKIVERLARGALTVGEISSGFSMSLPAISKHVKILEQSGLLVREIDGRVHHCKLAPRAMRTAATWFEKQERFWNSRLDDLDAYLKRTPDTSQSLSDRKET